MKAKIIDTIGFVTALIIVLFMNTAPFIMSSCSESDMKLERLRIEQMDRLHKEYSTGNPVDSTDLRSNTFEYNGHEYIHFISVKGEVCVVHNPDCWKCSNK